MYNFSLQALFICTSSLGAFLDQVTDIDKTLDTANGNSDRSSKHQKKADHQASDLRNCMLARLEAGDFVSQTTPTIPAKTCSYQIGIIRDDK
jgi:hypothetical protein